MAEQPRDSDPTASNKPTAEREGRFANLELTNDAHEVFSAEIDRIVERRKQAGMPPIRGKKLRKLSEKERPGKERRAVQQDLVGLALSGGGIRSGAFSLGVLQAFEKAGLLKFLDYLSTVSGGGYAGAFWSSKVLTSGDQASIDLTHDGRQPPRVMDFIYSGNYLARTAKFVNRFLPGWLLILVLVFSGLVVSASGLAYLFRLLDDPARRDAIAALGFADDVLLAFFPAACAFVLWSVAWILSYWKSGPSSQGHVAGMLWWLLIVTLLAAFGMLLGDGEISLDTTQSLLGMKPGAQSKSITFEGNLRIAIFTMIAAALTPYLKIKILLRSGQNPQNIWQKYTFKIASAALLVGLPFAVFAVFSRENISDWQNTRGPDVLLSDLFFDLDKGAQADVAAILKEFSDEDPEIDFELRKTLKLLTSMLNEELRTDVVRLARRYVSDADFRESDLKEALRDLGDLDRHSLTANEVKLSPSKLLPGEITEVVNAANRSWLQRMSNLTLPKKLTKHLSNLHRDRKTVGTLEEILKEYLTQKSYSRSDLRRDLDETLKLNVHEVDQIAVLARSFWPPLPASPHRQECLESELWPLIRDLPPALRDDIDSAAWSYAAEHGYQWHQLSHELELLDLKPARIEAIHVVVKNYWPPLTSQVTEKLTDAESDLELLERERTPGRDSISQLTDASLAIERLSIARRLRYALSYLFHMGVNSIVSDEELDTKFNLLHKIWSTHQRQRDHQQQLAHRLNHQILASPLFTNWMLRRWNQEIAGIHGTAVEWSASDRSASKDTKTTKAEEFKPTTLVQERFAAAYRHALQLSQRWTERFSDLREKASDNSVDPDKSDLETEESTTEEQTIAAIELETLRRQLIYANRKLLEAYFLRNEVTIPDHPATLRAEKIFSFCVLPKDQEFRWWYFTHASLLFLVALLVVDLNATSLHGFYRTQIARNWIEPVAGLEREIPLAQLTTTAAGAPYHLISASLNLIGLRRKHKGDSHADHFLFSNLYCGTKTLGFAKTSEFAGGDFKLADAIAISGAAISPAQDNNLMIRTLLFLGNMRLGQWVPNPAYKSRLPNWMHAIKYWFPMTAARFLWSSCQRAERRPFVFVADGGHFENLGIAPLLQRRCRLIIAFDVGADENFQFADLEKLVRWSRIKHGTHLLPLGEDEIRALIPSRPFNHPYSEPAADAASSEVANPSETVNAKEPFLANASKPRLAKSHYLLARIKYPDTPAHKKSGQTKKDITDLTEYAAKDGILIYLKANVTGDESFDLLRFAESHPDFPHHSTADQLYDPEQFSSYLELGRHIASELCEWLGPTNKQQRTKQLRQLLADCENSDEIKAALNKLSKSHPT